MENEMVIIQTADALEAINKSEIDSQVSTAHKFPRSLAKFNERAIEMVSQDIETAESCIYRRPVGKDNSGKQKIVEGESVRLAEIVAACYGNIRAGSFIIAQTERQVTARGFAHDLEMNNAQTCEVVELTVDRFGKPYSERMRIVTAKVALSKARRDAIFLIIPKALCKKIVNAARDVIRKDTKTIDQRIKSALEWTDNLKIKRKKVFETLGVKGVADIGLEELEILTGLKTAIKEGDITVKEAFEGSDVVVDENEKATARTAKTETKTEPVKQSGVSPELKKEIADCKVIEDLDVIAITNESLSEDKEFEDLIVSKRNQLMGKLL